MKSPPEIMQGRSQDFSLWGGGGGGRRNDF